jgi:peptidoglycan/xylan/chitin deacetylase (PgdA/CDA1 family)
MRNVRNPGRPWRRVSTVSAAILGIVAIGSSALVLSAAPARAAAVTAYTAYQVPDPGYAPGAPVVAITFDDGPSSAITPAILDTLERYGAHATFFVIGSEVAKHPELVARAAALGNGVGLHTMGHNDLTRVAPADWSRVVDPEIPQLQAITGRRATCIRPPGGATNQSVADLAAARGLTDVMWSVNPGDSQGATTDQIVSRAVGGARPGGIVALHDSATKAGTLAALPRVITGLRAKGLSIVPLCLGVAPIVPTRDVALRDDSSGYLLDAHGTLSAFGGAPDRTGPSFAGDLGRRVALRRDGTSGYVLDAYGGLHSFGGAPAATGSAYWPGWDIARGLTLRADGTSGYVLDGFGGLHAFGGAPAATGSAYWPGWDIARDVRLRADGAGGYVLDGFGALHAFGGATPPPGNVPYRTVDTARSLLLAFDGGSGYVAETDGTVRPFGNAPHEVRGPAWPSGRGHGLAGALSGNGLFGFALDDARHLALFGVGPRTRAAVARGDGRGGYTLDGYGGVHGFGGAPALAGGAAWPGWDIARAIALRSDGFGGYVLDGLGGLHPLGAAPAAVGPSFPADLARAVALRAGGTSGYVLDAYGGLHPFGGAPAVTGAAYWPGLDVARGLLLRTDGASGYVLDRSGALHPFGGAPPVSCTAYWPGWDIARAVSSRDGGVSGYVLDGYGGLHAFGGAPPVTGDYWTGHDVATVLVQPTAGAPVVVDVYGGLHPAR